jgi:DNA (cytosine-5)-methyltransferase 3A
MNVLSLFDGMSCGQQALNRAGIKINQYYASEIDKFAIKVTINNYPDTIQLGSVINVDGYKLPKIDLLIGGSPCQSFSFAGKRNGMITKNSIEVTNLNHYLQLKKDGFEFDGQSYLFWEYVRILHEVKPKYFLLENVIMIEKWEKIITKALNVQPIEINSSLVSAQNRRRLYWTNIGMQPQGLFNYPESIINQPKDKKILLHHILETIVDENYFLSDKMLKYIKVAKFKQDKKLLNEFEKSDCLLAERKINVTIHNTMPRSSKNGNGGNGPLQKNDGKSYCLDTGNSNAIEIFGGDYRSDDGYRWRNNHKSPTLCTSTEALAKINKTIRRLTPIECERLQTVKDNYSDCVSDSQRYRMLGNGWTVDVIAHIFKYIQ